MLHLLLAAALAGSPATAVPPASPPAASQLSESRLAAARQLVDVIHPTAAMIDSNVRSWEAVARKQAQTDQAMAKLEKEFPGVIEASIKASRPVAVEFSTNFVREAKATKSRIVAEQLTIAEMQEIQQFFATPAGARFLTHFSDKADVENLADELTRDTPDKAAEDKAKDAIDKTMRTTLSGVISDTSADDVIEIMKFEARPVARKFAAAGQAADEALLKILLNPDPEIGVRYREAATKGALSYIESVRAGGVGKP